MFEVCGTVYSCQFTADVLLAVGKRIGKIG